MEGSAQHSLGRVEQRGEEGAYLREVSQQTKGDGSRPTAHLQNSGTTMGSHRMEPLGLLL